MVHKINGSLKKHPILVLLVGINGALLIAKYFFVITRSVSQGSQLPIPLVLGFLSLFTMAPIWIFIYGGRINFFAGRSEGNSEFGQKVNSWTAIFLSYIVAVGIFLLWVVELQRVVNLL